MASTSYREKPHLQNVRRLINRLSSWAEHGLTGKKLETFRRRKSVHHKGSEE